MNATLRLSLRSSSQAQKHLEKYQNINNKLDEHNRTLIKANETLQKEFDSQNEDRNYLIQKLVEEKRRR
jgi:hypothetical protein